MQPLLLLVIEYKKRITDNMASKSRLNMVQTLTYCYTDIRNALPITAWVDGTAAMNWLTVSLCNKVESPFSV